MGSTPSQPWDKTVTASKAAMKQVAQKRAPGYLHNQVLLRQMAPQAKSAAQEAIYAQIVSIDAEGEGVEMPICYCLGVEVKAMSETEQKKAAAERAQNIQKGRNGEIANLSIKNTGLLYDASTNNALNFASFTPLAEMRVLYEQQYLYLSPEVVIVSGGKNCDALSATNEVFVWNTKTNTVSVQLPGMHDVRYAHSSTFFKGVLYVFGGRQLFLQKNTESEESQLILNRCEQFSFSENRWIRLRPMQTPRYGAHVLIFLDQIYIFGGVSLQGIFKRNVERYNPFLKQWDQLDWKLHRGVAEGLCCTTMHVHEFLLLGGRTRYDTPS